MCLGRPSFHPPGYTVVPPHPHPSGGSYGPKLYFLPTHLGENPLQGYSDPRGCQLSSSGCRPGRLLHRHPLPHSASLVSRPWLQDPAPCSEASLLLSPQTLDFVHNWLMCNQINLVGGALCQAVSPTPHPARRGVAGGLAVRRPADLGPPGLWDCLPHGRQQWKPEPSRSSGAWSLSPGQQEAESPQLHRGPPMQKDWVLRISGSPAHKLDPLGVAQQLQGADWSLMGWGQWIGWCSVPQ